MKVKEIITQVVILRLLVIQRQAKLAYISFGYDGWQWPKYLHKEKVMWYKQTAMHQHRLTRQMVVSRN
jgi:hypothetical protein